MKNFNLKNIVKNIKESKRLFIVFLSCLFVLNYFMFCYLTDKNVFNIFPSFPIVEEKKEIKVFLPAIDGVTIIQENRKIAKFNNDQSYIQYLFYTVVKGSMFNNTSMTVPVELIIKKIWVHENHCLINLEADMLKKQLKNSNKYEENFKKALTKTIISNISNIKSVSLSKNGIEGVPIW